MVQIPRIAQSVTTAARQPHSAASLAVVRIGIGAIAVGSIVRLWYTGWLDALVVDPDHHLSYPAFGWVPVPSALGIWMLSVLALLAAVGFTIGFRTRISGLVFVASFGWLELIEATTYLNHYWLLGALVVTLAIVPSGSRWSLDAGRTASQASTPALALWAVRAQVGAVYFFAGVAKLHYDWLFEALPLRIWLPSRSDLAIVGPLLEHPETALIASWAGAAFDLSIAFLLLYPRTRRLAFTETQCREVQLGILDEDREHAIQERDSAR